MANFVRVKPAGWALNEILTSAQMNALDIDHAASVNGDGGGGYVGALNWTGNHSFQANVENRGEMTKTTGARPGNRLGTVANSDADMVASVDEYRWTTAPVIPRTYTIRHTGTVPIVGQRIRATMTLVSAAADAIFVREGGSPEIARISGGGNGGFVEFTWTGSAWVTSAAGGDGAYTVPHS